MVFNAQGFSVSDKGSKSVVQEKTFVANSL